MPTLARCRQGCTQLRYYAGRCKEHYNRFDRVYVTEPEYDYVKKLLVQDDKVNGKRFGREQDLEHKQMVFQELDRLHRVSSEG
jgi:hypothetical protein